MYGLTKRLFSLTCRSRRNDEAEEESTRNGFLFSTSIYHPSIYPPVYPPLDTTNTLKTLGIKHRRGSIGTAFPLFSVLDNPLYHSVYYFQQLQNQRWKGIQNGYITHSKADYNQLQVGEKEVPEII